MKAFVLAGLIGLALAAAGSAQAGPAPLTADIKDAKGATLGTLTLTGAPRGVLLTVEVKGLPPGVHGMHFHEKGSCAEPKFESAGGHVHGMAGTRHGLMNADATDDGDLPNLHVAADGTATVELYSTLVRLDAADGAARRRRFVADHPCQPGRLHDATDRRGRGPDRLRGHQIDGPRPRG